MTPCSLSPQFAAQTLFSQDPAAGAPPENAAVVLKKDEPPYLPRPPTSPENPHCLSNRQITQTASPALAPVNEVNFRRGASSELSLSRQNFEDCDTLVRSYLLQPYDPLNPGTADTIERLGHGVQHASRMAVWALALLQLRRQHRDVNALALPDEMTLVLLKACLLHDSGREADGQDKPEWEAASADNLKEHLQNLGFSQAMALQCSQAIINKDQSASCQHLPVDIRTIRSLLHDADVLDVMRTRSQFYLNKLEGYQSTNQAGRTDYVLLAKNVREVIASQGDLNSLAAIYEQQGGECLQQGMSTSFSLSEKKKWEHAKAPFSQQLRSICNASTELKELLSSATLHLPEPVEFSLKAMRKVSGAIGRVGGFLTGKYWHEGSNTYYYVKEAEPESAKNQVLMASLARLLGINVPTTFVHEENGNTFVVSEWQDGLKSGREVLEELPKEHWVRILLVNSIIGNNDVLNSGWVNIEVKADGTPVMFDWDAAGLCSRYQISKTSKSWADDFSSLPLLLKHLRDLNAPFFHSCKLIVGCRGLFAKLTDQDLLGGVETLLNETDWAELDRLIETSGFKAGDRTWLRQTIHDRIAWLATRFPQACSQYRVTPAEYKAMEAAGVRGLCFQTSPQDIHNGQLRIFQRLDENDSPQTCLTGTLTPHASRRLADHLGLEYPLSQLDLHGAIPEPVCKHPGSTELTQ